jgi:hypothetical protein
VLRLGAGDPTPLIAAAQRRGVPLTVLDVTAPSARALYSAALVLVRPDQHVAWRGDWLPADPVVLLARVCGVS